MAAALGEAKVRRGRSVSGGSDDETEFAQEESLLEYVRGLRIFVAAEAWFMGLLLFSFFFEQALFWAVDEVNIAKVMALLEREGVDVNWQNKAVGNVRWWCREATAGEACSRQLTAWEQQKTALHIAVEKDNTTLAALLLGRGAEVDGSLSLGCICGPRS